MGKSLSLVTVLGAGERGRGERGEGVVEVPNERDNKPLKETDLAVAQAFLDS